jgi:hypothetical protein
MSEAPFFGRVHDCTTHTHQINATMLKSTQQISKQQFHTLSTSTGPPDKLQIGSRNWNLLSMEKIGTDAYGGVLG